MPRVDRARLQVDSELVAFVENEALPGTDLRADEFWAALAALISDLTPRNQRLLAVRDEMQAAIDRWHLERAEVPHDAVEYKTFLYDLGYLLPEGDAFQITTEGVDPEIATIAGPQLVVPVMNARYAINAANARWGSLYDALYGTDAIGTSPPAGPYDQDRGADVVAAARRMLDDAVPLVGASHIDSVGYQVVDGVLVVNLSGGTTTGLTEPDGLVGYLGEPSAPTSVLLQRHGIHIEIVIDASHLVGATDAAGVADIVLESAITSIMDCEDSVAAVDAADKVLSYRNWFGLMAGTLTTQVTKAGETFTRSLAPDRQFRSVSDPGSHLILPGLALMLIRNVGHLMTTPAILNADGSEVPEGILDAVFTSLGAMHGKNSLTGSIYIVKPKMHGPDEAAFTNELFDRVEDLLGLERNTIKVGVMDEERRTSLNLAECIRAVKDRVVFINTGFLDRTGDEMHTSMHAGAMVRKSDMRAQRWILAYEDWNVDVGLACGLSGRAQIGKGMWAAPDLMHDMLGAKIGHPLAGANCAWVPSPTAATLHATHYHQVSVADVQAELAAGGPRATIDDLLLIPVEPNPSWSANEVQAELDNNAQGILGYVVRWVDQGIGCSKVPDIHDVGLMEDRATCRISSQHIANWLNHGIVTQAMVQETFERMAGVVDAQNANDPRYEPMAPTFDGAAYCAATDLVFSGTEQPSGYTEPILHARRTERKRAEQTRTGETQ
ncbi:MAG: malate synthase G [Actinobacteria bacterium]|nr:malate synthase G [Actinomycetota bacterium]